MTVTLDEVAGQYAQESRRGLSDRRRHQADRMAKFLRWTVCNRAGVDRDRHTITHAGDPGVTLRWVESHGYRPAITGAGLGSGGVSMLMQRDGDLLIARIGDALTWDGTRITVTREGERRTESRADLPA
jgi:hypothetical protein